MHCGLRAIIITRFFGRLTYMMPYLQRDLDRGVLTEDEAKALLEDFSYDLISTAIFIRVYRQGDNGQSMMLGGLCEDAGARISARFPTKSIRTMLSGRHEYARFEGMSKSSSFRHPRLFDRRRAGHTHDGVFQRPPASDACGAITRRGCPPSLEPVC